MHLEPGSIPARIFVQASPCSPRTQLELQEPSRITVSPQLAEADRYAQEYGQQPELDTIGGPSVATADDLPPATAADTYRLVRAERRYYKSVATSETTTDPDTNQSTTPPQLGFTGLVAGT